MGYECFLNIMCFVAKARLLCLCNTCIDPPRDLPQYVPPSTTMRNQGERASEMERAADNHLGAPRVYAYILCSKFRSFYSESFICLFIFLFFFWEGECGRGFCNIFSWPIISDWCPWLLSIKNALTRSSSYRCSRSFCWTAAPKALCLRSRCFLRPSSLFTNADRSSIWLASIKPYSLFAWLTDESFRELTSESVMDAVDVEQMISLFVLL